MRCKDSRFAAADDDGAVVAGQSINCWLRCRARVAPVSTLEARARQIGPGRRSVVRDGHGCKSDLRVASAHLGDVRDALDMTYPTGDKRRRRRARPVVPAAAGRTPGAQRESSTRRLTPPRSTMVPAYGTSQSSGRTPSSTSWRRTTAPSTSTISTRPAFRPALQHRLQPLSANQVRVGLAALFPQRHRGSGGRMNLAVLYQMDPRAGRGPDHGDIPKLERLGTVHSAERSRDRLSVLDD